MKPINRDLNDNSGDEELKKEQSHDELNNVGVDEHEEDEGEEFEDDGDEEVDDNEDVVDEKENVPNNTFTEGTQHQYLGGGNLKIQLNKTTTKYPPTAKMVDEAIKELNERGGSSPDAIRKYIMNKNPGMIEKRLKMQIKRYLTNCVTDGTIMQVKRSFKFTKKHTMKKKPKLVAKKEKESEKEKVKKEEKKPQKTDKAVGKKVAKNEKSTEKPAKKRSEKPTEKPKVEAKAAKNSKTANTEAKAKPAKTTKLEKAAKNTKSTESKQIMEPKTKIKSRKSINLVVRPTLPRPKTLRNTKTTAKAKNEKIDPPASKSVPVASLSASVKIAGRGKKK